MRRRYPKTYRGFVAFTIAMVVLILNNIIAGQLPSPDLPNSQYPLILKQIVEVMNAVNSVSGQFAKYELGAMIISGIVAFFIGKKVNTTLQ